MRIEGEKSYSNVFIKGRKNKAEVAFRLGVTEHFFPFANFFRTHQSHLVNLNHAICYWPHGRGYMILMSDGEKVPVAKAKEKKQAFEERVKSFTNVTLLECDPALVRI
jgi:two-component system, LytTR family, response regulator